MRLYTCEPGTEVRGTVLSVLVENVRSDETLPLLEKYGFLQTDPQEWYPLQNWLNIFNEIVRQNGDTSSFIAMGTATVNRAELPEGMAIPTLSQILEGWNDFYQFSHQNGYLPPIETVKLDSHHYQLVFSKDHIYPCDLAYGMVWGYCKEYLPPKTPFTVKYDDYLNPRNSDAEEIIIDIKWG